jgi:hypothetical protein
LINALISTFGFLMRFPDVDALAVQLDRASEVPELLTEPPETVRQSALNEAVVPLLGLQEPGVDGRQAVRIVAERDLG